MQQYDRLIGRLKAQCILKGGIKFGVEIPGTVEEEVSLDGKNGNSLWQDAIEKEMNNLHISFKMLRRHGKPPAGNTEITCHLVSDLKIDMTRKN